MIPQCCRIENHPPFRSNQIINGEYIHPNILTQNNYLFQEWSPRLRRQADNSATLSFHFYYSVRLIFTISKKTCQVLQKVSYMRDTRMVTQVLSMTTVMMQSADLSVQIYQRVLTVRLWALPSTPTIHVVIWFQ